MNFLKTIAGICLVVLIAIGIQYGLNGAIKMRDINFDTFTTFNWICEGLYITLAICLGILLGEQD